MITVQWQSLDSNPHLSGATICSVTFKDASRLNVRGTKVRPKSQCLEVGQAQTTADHIPHKLSQGDESPQVSEKSDSGLVP